MASPDYNAESYAAAATGGSILDICRLPKIANSVFVELYFMELCEFSEIRIRTFDD